MTGNCRIAELPNCRRDRRAISGRSVIIAIAVILCAQIASACSIVFVPEKVKPSFIVQVKGFGQAIQGVRVEAAHLTKWEEDGASHFAFSDASGNAKFESLPVGTYAIRADRFHANNVIEVVPDAEAKTSYVQIGWPGSFSSAGDSRTLKTKQLAGHVIVPVCRTAQCVLSLYDGITGERIGNELPAGSFDFGSHPFGPYMLRVKDDSGQSGDIALRLSADAPTDYLEVGVNFSSCGISYSEAHECPASHLDLWRLKGTVVDPTDAAIPHAMISLLASATSATSELATVSSDEKGEWRFDEVASGDYRLRVTAPGFTLHSFPITMSGGASGSDLRITMGVLGACSKAEVRSGGN